MLRNNDSAYRCASGIKKNKMNGEHDEQDEYKPRNKIIERNWPGETNRAELNHLQRLLNHFPATSSESADICNKHVGSLTKEGWMGSCVKIKRHVRPFNRRSDALVEQVNTVNLSQHSLIALNNKNKE